MAKDFLLEIGVEELPARFLLPALEQLRELTEKGLRENRLAYQEIFCCGTPRRITVFARGVAEKQEALVQEVKGPAVKVAYSPQGEPTRAAFGFAKSQGMNVDQLVTRTIGAVDYVFALKKEEGNPAPGVLEKMVPGLVEGLHFPKPMRWANLEMRFARPIRWLVCLYGADVIPLTMAGLTSQRSTRGHRFLSSGQLEIPTAAAYFEVMEQAHVIVDVQRRRDLIRRQVEEVAAREGGRADIDAGLLDEVTNLVEYPTALCGSFDASYLDLPEEVLITPMREHQRYFPVRGAQGQLLPRFIAVSNGGTRNIATVRAGNEKVLRARLADAAFFWQEDLKTPLADRVEGLKKVVFQESLGSVYDKVQRIGHLAQFIASCLGLEDGTRAEIKDAAYLAKADLITNMVYEFPELQGVMGREYALRSGAVPAVAQAIYEHYLPRFAGDDLPQTLPGQVLSLADKLDTLVGCFGMGIHPTGSQDPYALRRQALGVCHIVIAGQQVLSLGELIGQAFDGYHGLVPFKLTREQVTAELTEFFRQRLRVLFMDRGLPYDTVDAVLSAGFDDVAGAWLRVQALEEFRGDPAFGALLTAFTRAHNLSKKAHQTNIDENLFEAAVERDLYGIYQDVLAAVQPHLEARDYPAALSLIAGLQPPVDRFFEEIMVMVENLQVRDNRLALLKRVAQLTGSIANLSKIVE